MDNLRPSSPIPTTLDAARRLPLLPDGVMNIVPWDGPPHCPSRGSVATFVSKFSEPIVPAMLHLFPKRPAVKVVPLKPQSVDREIDMERARMVYTDWHSERGDGKRNEMEMRQRLDAPGVFVESLVIEPIGSGRALVRRKDNEPVPVRRSRDATPTGRRRCLDEELRDAAMDEEDEMVVAGWSGEHVDQTRVQDARNMIGPEETMGEDGNSDKLIEEEEVEEAEKVEEAETEGVPPMEEGRTTHAAYDSGVIGWQRQLRNQIMAAMNRTEEGVRKSGGATARRPLHLEGLGQSPQPHKDFTEPERGRREYIMNATKAGSIERMCNHPGRV